MTETDEELMGRFCDGNDRAFAELYRRHRKPLIAAMRRAGPPRDAEDVVQDAFVRLHRARDSYQRGQPVRPWLWTIAHNLRKDVARRSVRRAEVRIETVSMVAANDQTARTVERAEHAWLLHGAIERLTPILRFMTVAHWLEERDFEEIALASGQRAGTVRVRAHRACLRLREILAPVLAAA